MTKVLARLLLGRYLIFKIYECESQPSPHSREVKAQFGIVDGHTTLCQSECAELRELSDCAGDDAYGFGAWIDGKLVSACWFWGHKRYNPNGIWPPSKGDAKLVRVVTSPSHRGTGIASNLIRFASNEMQKQGYKRLYAKIWHSNRPSLAAFSRAGWREIATVAHVFPLGIFGPWRVVFGRRDATRDYDLCERSVSQAEAT
jgi:GNAT superfamily N-acetyltransferase